MDSPGVHQIPEGSGEQGKMEKTGYKIICGAPTTLTVKGLMMMMMMWLGLLKTLMFVIFSNTVSVINIKLCMMVLLLVLYLFMSFSVTLTIFQAHSSVKTVSTENFILLSGKLEAL